MQEHKLMHLPIIYFPEKLIRAGFSSFKKLFKRHLNDVHCHLYFYNFLTLLLLLRGAKKPLFSSILEKFIDHVDI